MAKILSITLNPAIDLTVQLDQLKVGEVNRQLTAQSHAAGKGLNVAQVLKDLGHELIVSGFLGQENRQIFDHHIQQEQFDNQFIYVAGQTRQNIKVAEASGQMTDINGKGFFVDTSAKQQLCERLSQLILEVDVIVIAGSLPQGFSADIDPELLILNIWAITQNYADFATQMEMVTGKTLRNRSMQQRIIQHTVHMMLYGVIPRTDK